MIPNNHMNTSGIDFSRPFGGPPASVLPTNQPPFAGQTNPQAMAAFGMNVNGPNVAYPPVPQQQTGIGGRQNNNRNFSNNNRNYQQQHNNGLQKRMRRY